MVELNKLLKDVGEGAGGSGVTRRSWRKGRCRGSWQKQEQSLKALWFLPLFLPPVLIHAANRV